MPKLTEEDQVRLIATRFVRKGFRGRARLTEQAAGGDLVALAVLESRLGLADRATAVREAYEETVERVAFAESRGFVRERRHLSNLVLAAPDGEGHPRGAEKEKPSALFEGRGKATSVPTLS